MSDEVGDRIENALNLIVGTTEQSGNMKKGLKQIIFETVSTLRELFAKLKATGYSKINEISKLTEQVTKTKADLQECSGTQAKEHRTPSIVDSTVLADTLAMEHGTPSSVSCLELAATTTRSMAVPSGGVGRLYAAAAGEKKATNLEDDCQI